MDSSSVSSLKPGNLKQEQGSRFTRIYKHFLKDRQLLLIFLPCIIFYIVFRYAPMYGIIVAFKKYNSFQGVLGSPWVGLKYFNQFFSSEDFLLLLRNTFLLGIYSLLWTFPFPIAFALLLNELPNKRFKKSVQTISYLPSFLSVVIICSMVIDFLSPGHGLVNNILSSLGLPKIYFIAKPEWFRTIYIASGIWSGTGFGAIIYLAALTGIDQTLYEAGTVDGCGRFRAMWHISLPGIFPTIVTMFILSVGGLFQIGFEKVILLYNPMTYETADVFATYVYRKGILESNLSYGTAAGLFESLVSLVLLLIANGISRRLSERSLW